MGGNPSGVPVVVIGLEKDDWGKNNGNTVFFADRTGLEIVVDDSEHDVLHQFFSPNRGEGTNNSDFVVLNGVPNSPSHKLWEIVYTRSFRPSISSFRDAIDSVEAGAAMEPTVPLAPAEPPVLANPTWANGRFSFTVQGTVGHVGMVEFSGDGENWTLLREIPFTEEPVSVVDNSSESGDARFYRVTSSQ